MTLPTDIEIFENPLASFWLDKDGIMNIITHPVLRNIENSKALIQQMGKAIGEKKVYAISDINSTGELSDEAREYYNKEVPKHFKAFAFITSTPLGRMVGTIYSLIFNASVPTKIFSNESAAFAWLKELQVAEKYYVPKKENGKKLTAKIILVDDQSTEKILMEYALKESKWDVKMEFFSNAMDALKYLRETKDEIFLIISDINMPKMNGFEFKKEIDSDTFLKQKSIPFIFMSNSATPEEIIESYDNNVHSYFKKPMTVEEYGAMLDKIFNYWLVNKRPN